jgi:hypothetical protein
MPATYEPIATTTLGSAQTTITLSSIPATYTDLVLIGYLRLASGTSSGCYRLNGDTGNNYSTISIWGDGSTASSYRNSNISVAYFDTGTIPNAADTFMPVILHFMNYSNTTTNKTIIGRSSNSSSLVQESVNLYRSTSAINSIEIRNDANVNFATGSMLSLYGIKAA